MFLITEYKKKRLESKAMRYFLTKNRMSQCTYFEIYSAVV